MGTKLVSELVYDDLDLFLLFPDGALLQQQYSGLAGSRGGTDVASQGGEDTALLYFPCLRAQL